MTMRFNGGIEASRDTFAALVDREPLYAPGYSGLAHAYLLLEFFRLDDTGGGLSEGRDGSTKGARAGQYARPG
jgi:hypothetical protein